MIYQLIGEIDVRLFRDKKKKDVDYFLESRTATGRGATDAGNTLLSFEVREWRRKMTLRLLHKSRHSRFRETESIFLSSGSCRQTTLWSTLS